MDLGPTIRQLESPLTRKQLAPLDPACRVVQFSAPLKPREYRRVAALLERHPQVALRAYGHHGQSFDLGFLQYFPQLKAFSVEVHALQDLGPLAHLPADLERLSIGATKSKRPDLSVLSRFRHLQSLFVEGHTKGLEVLGELTALKELTLRSVTLPDLSLLLPLRELRALELKLGGTRDLSLLPRVGRLHYLELWMVRGLDDLSPVAELADLQFLFLQALRRVEALPDLSGLSKLRRLHLETLKGLEDLSPVADARGLEDLLVLDMAHLPVEAFQPLVGHPTLKRCTLGLGQRKNEAVRALLGLEALSRLEPFVFA